MWFSNQIFKAIHKSIVRNHCLRLNTQFAKNTHNAAPNIVFMENMTARDVKIRKYMGIWLATSTGAVFCTIILGGITRLTESGLSMVTWSLFKESPPKSHAQWEIEFEKYKQYPEFKIKNSDITLKDFKRIWWMEYAHRQAGRLSGFIFLVPAIGFMLKHAMPIVFVKRMYAISGLFLIQGLLGWYMVKSGLTLPNIPTFNIDPKIKDHNKNRNGENENLESDNFLKYFPINFGTSFHSSSGEQHQQQPVRVSPYRLAAHLGTAFILYSLLLWGTLNYTLPTKLEIDVKKPPFQIVRRFAHGTKSLIFLTALSGAFVAGLDAGLIYNSFPLMGESWKPPTPELTYFRPFWRNLFENPSTVQFDHRLLGYITFGAIVSTWLVTRKAINTAILGNANLATNQSIRRLKLASNALAIAGITQVTLGISTLLLYVPTFLASCHQAGSLTLLSIAIWLTHELRRIPKL